MSKQNITLDRNKHSHINVFVVATAEVLSHVLQLIDKLYLIFYFNHALPDHNEEKQQILFK